MNSETTAITRAWVISGLLLVGALVLLGARLDAVKIYEEIFGTVLELVVGVFGIALLLQSHRRALAKNAMQEALTRDLDELVMRLRRAKLLMHAHRSGRTWGEQMRNLIGTDAELHQLIKRATLYAATDADTVAGTRRSTLNLLRCARAQLRALLDEYVEKHDEVEWLQFEFEKNKAVAPSAAALTQLRNDQWRATCERIPRAAQFAEKRPGLRKTGISSSDGLVMAAALRLWFQLRSDNGPRDRQRISATSKNRPPDQLKQASTG